MKRYFVYVVNLMFLSTSVGISQVKALAACGPTQSENQMRE